MIFQTVGYNCLDGNSYCCKRLQHFTNQFGLTAFKKKVMSLDCPIWSDKEAVYGTRCRIFRCSLDVSLSIYSRDFKLEKL